MAGICVLCEEEIKNFLTLPQEKLIIAVRQHPIVLIWPIVLILVLTLLGFGLIVFWFSFILTSNLILLLYILLLVSMALTGIIKILSDWYYHLYIITSRKILELKCIPIFSDRLDNVFLDQVRTTEIDVNVKNLLNEVLNVGDVTVAFDRPSHDELFVLSDIYNPRTVARILSLELEAMMVSSPVWFNRDKLNATTKFAEDIPSAVRLGQNGG